MILGSAGSASGSTAATAPSCMRTDCMRDGAANEAPAKAVADEEKMASDMTERSEKAGLLMPMQEVSG